MSLLQALSYNPRTQIPIPFEYSLEGVPGYCFLSHVRAEWTSRDLMSYSETLTTGNLCPAQCASRCPLARMCAHFWSTVEHNILPSGKFTYHLTTLLCLSIFGRFSSLSTAVYPFTAHFHFEGTPICTPYTLPDTTLLYILVFRNTIGFSDSFLKWHWFPINFRKGTTDIVIWDNTYTNSLLFMGTGVLSRG